MLSKQQCMYEGQRDRADMRSVSNSLFYFQQNYTLNFSKNVYLIEDWVACHVKNINSHISAF